jgi:hypothetical protein
VVADRKVEIEVKGLDIKESFAYVTDKFHLYTQVPVEFENGKASMWISPNSVIYMDIR